MSQPSGAGGSGEVAAGAGQPAGRAIVSYDEVEKTYGEGAEAVRALHDINGEIARGEFVSFVGPSGCGKSTLLHVTSGITPATGGSVHVDGIDVQSSQHEKYKVGLVFQKPILLEWRTILENVMLPVEIMSENGVLDEGIDTYRDRAYDLIELVGIDGFEDSYPRELSGGMQQRASICRSLLYDPPVLLMDEPFGALDALTRDQLNVELLRIWNETRKTILFVTHNLEEAVFLSDRIFVLSARPGRVLDVIDVDLGRPRDVDTRKEDRYHELVNEAYEFFRG